MLDDECKKNLEESHCFLAEFNPESLQTLNYSEILQYAVSFGVPIYVVKQKGFDDLDHLLKNANLKRTVEYDGEIGSKAHEEAQSELLNIIAEEAGSSQDIDYVEKTTSIVDFSSN